MTKAFVLKFSMKALFFWLMNHTKERLPKLVRQPLLTWSHYFELLKCDNTMEMQFYFQEAINQKWKVRELQRQIKSSLFQRLALHGS